MSTGARERPRATGSGCAPCATTATATPLGGRGPGRERGLPHRGAVVLLPGLRRRRPRRRGRGNSGPGVSTSGSRPDRPGRDVFIELCRDHRIVPVWRELVADTLTPVSAFMVVVGERAGFLLESVEGGERWGRYSFVGRNPLATLVSHGLSVTASGALELPPAVRARSDEGILATIDAMLSAYRSPEVADLPPLHGGLVGYLGYDVVREVEHLPNVPRDDTGVPDAVLHVIGQLCAFDHWRQRVVLVDNVVVGDGWGEAPGRRGLRSSGHAPRRTGRRPGPPARMGSARGAAPRRGPARGARRPCPRRRSRTRCAAPRSSSGPGTSSRSCCRSASTSSSVPIRSPCTACCGS